MVHVLQKLKNFLENFLPSEIFDEQRDNNLSLVDMVNIAKEEWVDARRYFEEITDPTLIDHAIYRMESAEKKYMYLLKLANKEKVVNRKVSIY